MHNGPVAFCRRRLDTFNPVHNHQGGAISAERHLQGRTRKRFENMVRQLHSITLASPLHKLVMCVSMLPRCRLRCCQHVHYHLLRKSAARTLQHENTCSASTTVQTATELQQRLDSPAPQNTCNSLLAATPAQLHIHRSYQTRK
jgi:hypothetical protein